MTLLHASTVCRIENALVASSPASPLQERCIASSLSRAHLSASLCASVRQDAAMERNREIAGCDRLALALINHASEVGGGRHVQAFQAIIKGHRPPDSLGPNTTTRISSLWLVCSPPDGVPSPGTMDCPATSCIRQVVSNMQPRAWSCFACAWLTCSKAAVGRVNNKCDSRATHTLHLEMRSCIL